MDISWIKIKTDIFDDEKIKLIESIPEADSVIVIWFKLLTLAGKSNNNGVFMLSEKIPYTDEMLSTIFRRPINTIRLALQTFSNFGMIDIVENVITIPKWQKHQNIEGLEKAREQNRLRVQKYRQKQIEKIECAENVTLPVTLHNATEKKREEKKREEKKREEKESTENDSFFALSVNKDFVEEIFKRWSGYGFLNRGKIDFINRFNQIMPLLKGYHSDDIYGAIDNYKKVVDSGGWYTQKHNLNFESFCKNISQFMTGNFDLRNYCEIDKVEKIEKEKEHVYEICPCCNEKKLEWIDEKQNYYCYGCKSLMTYDDVQKRRG